MLVLTHKSILDQPPTVSGQDITETETFAGTDLDMYTKSVFEIYVFRMESILNQAQSYVKLDHFRAGPRRFRTENKNSCIRFMNTCYMS